MLRGREEAERRVSWLTPLPAIFRGDIPANGGAIVPLPCYSGGGLGRGRCCDGLAVLRCQVPTPTLPRSTRGGGKSGAHGSLRRQFVDDVIGDSGLARGWVGGPAKLIEDQSLLPAQVRQILPGEFIMLLDGLQIWWRESLWRRRCGGHDVGGAAAPGNTPPKSKRRRESPPR